MSSTFPTVDGKLLTDVTAEIPDWISDVDFKQSPRAGTLDVGFDQRTVNARRTAAKRDGMTGHVRSVKRSFNEATLRAAALARLAAFLGGHRFEVTGTTVADGEVTVTAVVDQRPFTYEFTYVDASGHLDTRPSFRTALHQADGEVAVRVYPFTTAGLSDSLEDEPDVADGTAVVIRQAVGGKSVMTRMEIIRRCGNRLQVAKEAIQRSLDEGLIVAVGSNEYASIYDMTCLFPDLNEAPVREAAHTAEFVHNRVATAVSEHKSADRLKLEAAALLNRDLDLRHVDSVARDGDALLVQAVVAFNNVRQRMHFSIAMDGERLGAVQFAETEDGEKMSVQQLLQRSGDEVRLANYLRTADARDAGGYVYSTRAVHQAVGSFLKTADVNQLINDWCANGYAQRLQTTTIASRYTLNELLRLANAELLSEEDVRRVRADRAFFGQGLAVERVEGIDDRTRAPRQVVHDADVRAAFVHALPAHVVCLSCDAVQVEADEVSFLARCFNRRTGVTRVLDVIMDRDGGRLTSPRFAIAGRAVDLDKAFSSTELVQEVGARRGALTPAPAQFTVEQLARLVDGLVDPACLDDVVDAWVATGAVARVDTRTLASRLPLGDLLEAANLVAFDAETRASVLAAKARLNELLVDRVDVADGDTRSALAVEAMVAEDAAVHDYVGAFFKDFALRRVGRGVYTLAFNGDPGRRLSLMAAVEDGDVVNVFARVAGQDLALAELAARFERSPMLTKLVNEGLVHRVDGARGVVVSHRLFLERLGDFMPEDDVEQLIDRLLDSGDLVLISRTGGHGFRHSGEVYASAQPFDQLMRGVDALPDDALRALRLAKANRLAAAAQRVDVADGDSRSAEAGVLARERLANVRDAVDAVLKNVQVHGLGDGRFALRFSVPDGRVHRLMATAKFDGAQLLALTVDVAGQAVRVDELPARFASSQLLRAYVRTFGDAGAARGFFSEHRLRTRLGSLLTEDDVQLVLDQLLGDGRLVRIDEDHLVSGLPLEDLLRSLDIDVDDDVLVLTLVDGDRTNMQRFVRAHVADGDVRRPTAAVVPRQVPAMFAAWLPCNYVLLGTDTPTVSGNAVSFGARCMDRTKGVCALFSVRAEVDGGRLRSVRLLQGGRSVDLANGFVTSQVADLYCTAFGVDNADAGRVIDLSKLRSRLARLADVENFDEVVDGWLATGAARRVAADQLVANCTLTQLLSSSALQPLPAEVIADNLRRAAVQRNLVPRADHVDDPGTRTARPRLTTADVQQWFTRRAECAGVHVRSFGDVDIAEDSLKFTATVVNDDGLTTDLQVCAEVDDGHVGHVQMTADDRCVGLDSCFADNDAAKLVAGDRAERHVWTRRALMAKLEPLVVDADEVVAELITTGRLQVLDDEQLVSRLSLPQLLTEVNAQRLTEDERLAKVARGVDTARVPLSVPEQGGVREAVDGRTDDHLRALRDEAAARLERLITAGRVSSTRCAALREQLAQVDTFDQLRRVTELVDRYEGVS